MDSESPRPGASAACEAALRAINGVLDDRAAEMTNELKVALAHRFGQMLRQAAGPPIYSNATEAERFTISRVRAMIVAQALPFRPARTEFAAAVVMCCDGLLEQLRNMGGPEKTVVAATGIEQKLYPAVGAEGSGTIAGPGVIVSGGAAGPPMDRPKGY